VGMSAFLDLARTVNLDGAPVKWQVVGPVTLGVELHRAGLDRVKSGAARIALGALPTAPDLVIQPIGMAFESKVETRSRAVVMFGEPIVVRDHATPVEQDPDGEPDRDDVVALTDRITSALEAVSPSFTSVDERELLRAAARTERFEESPGHEPRFGDVEHAARRLAAAPADARQRVISAYREYATRLQLIGVSDSQLRRRRLPVARLALSAVALALAGTLLATLTLFHVPAVVLVVVGTGLVRSTATKGTVRLLLGLVTAVTTWVVAGVWLADGWAALGVGIAVAVGGVAALVVWPPLIRQALIVVGRLRVRDRVGLLPPVLGARAAVAAEVRATLGDHDVD